MFESRQSPEPAQPAESGAGETLLPSDAAAMTTRAQQPKPGNGVESQLADVRRSVGALQQLLDESDPDLADAAESLRTIHHTLQGVLGNP